jgi:hypothetical protein
MHVPSSSQTLRKHPGSYFKRYILATSCNNDIQTQSLVDITIHMVQKLLLQPDGYSLGEEIFL